MGGTCVRDMRIGQVGLIGRDRFTMARRCMDSSAVMKAGMETLVGSMAVVATTAAVDSMVGATEGKDSCKL